MYERLKTVIGKIEGTYKSLPGLAIIQTRFLLVLLILLLARFPGTFVNSTLISRMMLIYIGFTVVLAFLSRTLLERSRLRAVRDLFDLVAISFLIRYSGGSDSPWFMLYLFPVMSAARYLGATWSVVVTVFSALTYAVASNIFANIGTQTGYAFCLRVVTLGGVALTAASLAKTRERAEARLLSALERIDLAMLSDTDSKKVMESIPNTAMEVTGSDLSALILLEGGQAGETFVIAGKISARLRDHALGIFQKYYPQVLSSGETLSLPERRLFGIMPAVLHARENVAYWPARLVPLRLVGPPFGVLAVFSCRILRHYTSNDVRKLSSMAPLVAMVQKNSARYRTLHSRNRESRERLQMLYDIGRQLKSEEGLDRLFETVVKLVSTRLGSEEAALFVPETVDRLVKEAVSGPNEEITARLAQIEQCYKAGDVSLTRRVFESRERLMVNNIAVDEDYATEYSEQLPSGITKHYIGVPLIIGDEVLGVIRVLNKKAADYWSQRGKSKLADDGFDADDLDLLTLIATQIAAAIRSARFIERFENLVYKSPHPIIVVDQAGKILNFNKECEKLWGLEEEKVLGTSVESYYESPQVAREIGGELWRTPGNTIRDRFAKVRDARGNLIPIRLSAAWLLDKNGNKVGSIGVFTDEREAIRREEEKLVAEKLAAIGRLAHTKGHDIKHDLSTALNYTEALQHNLTDSTAQQMCAGIRDATSKALDKLQNMLIVAKPSLPQKQVVSLKSMLAEFKDNVTNRMQATQIRFLVYCPDREVLISADAGQVRQVFANLLGNSVDAIRLARLDGNRSAGEITVTLETEGDTVLLSWHDDGLGMSNETKMKAFTPFFTTKNTGSGLGLFLTKNIIESHEGRIFVESELQQGVCFQISLPLFIEPTDSHGATGESRPVSKGTES